MHIVQNDGEHRDYIKSLIRDNLRPEDLGAKTLKQNNDGRITRFGKLLRRYSLDEIPQLINIYKGEMSLIGPRPSMPYEYALYAKRHMKRLTILPGITGLWQVTQRNQVSFNEMVELDIDYIEKMDFWLDMKILLLTPIEMLKGRGAG